MNNPKILHHGAINGVTGSCHELRLDTRNGILIDCGLFQGGDAKLANGQARDLKIDFPINLTADNGKEFTYHEKISKAVLTDVYFALPYSSWERGLNENTNGLLRQYFPKHTDLKTVTQTEVRRAVNRLNSRPRKDLELKTPDQLMSAHRAALAA